MAGGASFAIDVLHFVQHIQWPFKNRMESQKKSQYAGGGVLGLKVACLVGIKSHPWQYPIEVTQNPFS